MKADLVESTTLCASTVAWLVPTLLKTLKPTLRRQIGWYFSSVLVSSFLGRIYQAKIQFA
jgi:hypothetical protein